ncbi:hypothetical protein FDP41_011508 [Naegleria fowleri]|uniref:Peptidase M28 domain-containing protein n=1 Tax=Naegleria fowleri TaxID=5763 RepID=A0A6A5CA90_NAEFO|nr:uncharacterized protein FDP41_011508 [Naegleria fowleri]KAF0982578.1 hypothetical protein FDP41_011508 [Naegleria fowleri]
MFYMLPQPSNRRSTPTTTSLSPLLTLLLAVLVLTGSYLYQGLLPRVTHFKNDYSFREDRALKFLQQFSTQLGPRVVGTFQEKQSSDFLKLELMNVMMKHSQKEKDREESRNATTTVATTIVSGHLVRLEEQFGSGDCFIEIIGRKLFTHYTNLSNIMVRIDPPFGVDHANGDGLLISSHFDSGSTSPGFYDDGIPVTCMVETFHNLLGLIREDQLKLERSVIFLFNGAEEVGLLGAELFFQHVWSKDVKYFLNLEAAGSASKEVAFQIKNLFLAKQFAKYVKRASGNVVAQDVFQANIVPSATDYYIYNNRNLTGIDISFYKNGYVYHTSLDAERAYEAGGIQHMGDNVQGFVSHFASSKFEAKQMAAEKNIQKFVYFDVFGLFFATYSMETAKLMNISILVVAATLLGFSIFSKGIYSLFDRLVSLFFLFLVLLIGLATNMGFSILLVLNDKRMLFFAFHPMFSVALFGSILLFVYITSIEITRKFIYGLSTKGIRDAVTWVFVVFLTLFTYFNIPSGYIFTVTTTCLLLAYFIIPQLSLIFSLVGLAFLCSILNQIYDMFIPMSGRMGKALEADYGVAVLVTVTVFLMLCQVLPLLIADEKRSMIRTVVALFVVSLSLVMVLLLGNGAVAFTKLHPKRASLQHIFHFKANDVKYPLKNTHSYQLIISPSTSKEEVLLKGLNISPPFSRANEESGFPILPHSVKSVITPTKYPGPFLTRMTNNEFYPWAHVLPKILIQNYFKTNGSVHVNIVLDEQVFHSSVHIFTNIAIVDSSFQTPMNYSIMPSTRGEFKNEYIVTGVFGYNRDEKLMKEKSKVFSFWLKFDAKPQENAENLRIKFEIRSTFFSSTLSLTELTKLLPEWSQPITSTHSSIDIAPFELNGDNVTLLNY